MDALRFASSFVGANIVGAIIAIITVAVVSTIGVLAYSLATDLSGAGHRSMATFGGAGIRVIAGVYGAEIIIITIVTISTD